MHMGQRLLLDSHGRMHGSWKWWPHAVLRTVPAESAAPSKSSRQMEHALPTHAADGYSITGTASSRFSRPTSCEPIISAKALPSSKLIDPFVNM